MEEAIEIENQSMFATGDAEDTPEFRAEYESYREWQRVGHVFAGTALGVAMGSLFGAVFSISKESLPGRRYFSKALFLAGVMWFVLYVIPFIKYPPNPPAVGDPDTVTIRVVLYVVLIAASGLGALGFAKMASHLIRAKKLSARHGACVGMACYAAFAAMLLVVMPPNPDPAPAIDQVLLDGFRAASAIGVSLFWVSVGAILGIFWTVLAKKEDGRRESINSDSIY